MTDNVANKKGHVANKGVQNFLPIEDFPESSHRVRRNLMIFASLALFYKFSDARFKSECSNILGFGFENIGERSISVSLFLIVLYHFFHFFWLAFEHIMHNHILLSRPLPKNHVPTRVGSTDLSEEWNLYIWWQNNFKRFNKIFQNDEFSLDEMKKTLIDLKEKIEPSLKRFDDKYKSYISTQKLRWLFLELLLPLSLGFCAILVFLLSFF